MRVQLPNPGLREGWDWVADYVLYEVQGITANEVQNIRKILKEYYFETVE